ncbi:cytochrome P450 [Desertimonas flava]|uniref:cytochrome P450 n=1 Tax=Desertimonas flava TaxID=2064846 RepID=UPI0013C506AF|nr:cytochrome P450 [Desertimonas flava]
MRPAGSAVLGDPPGPLDPVPLELIRADPLGFLRSLVARHGPVVRHVVEGRPVVTVNDPGGVHHVLTANRANYVKTGTPDEQMLVPLLGRGLLTSDGDDWRLQRQLTQPAFQHRQLVTFDSLMSDVAQRLVDSWTAQEGAAVRVDRDLTAATLTIVAQALLGSDLAVGARFGAAVDAANRFMGHYGADAADPDGRREFLQAKRFLDQIVGLLIAAAGLDDTARADVLAQLLHARTGERPGGFSPVEIRDQVITLMMAGHETTAKALTWTLYLLDRHPAERDRLEREVDTVVGERAVTAADVPRLVACRNAIYEALRLHPPVWLISRTAVADDVVAGYTVPAGALVCVSPWLLHRRTDVWGDDVDDFVPDRFSQRGDVFAPGGSFLPFGAGPRQCIGQQFAVLESTIVLATVVAGVRLDIAPHHPPVEPEALVTLRPRHGLLMTPNRRPSRTR